jgi:colanic acid biosynthesis glycosyl transferase WcaI
VPNRPSGARRLLHHASFVLSAAFPLLSSAVRWQPDIVFAVAPSLLSAPLAAVAAKLTGAASWLHIQDMEVDVAFELGILKSGATRKLMLGIERTILNSFDRVSAISPQMVARLKHKGISEDKLVEFRNWVDTGVIVPSSPQTNLRSSLGLKPTDIVALYSGAMSNKQGLELIIDAAGAARSSHPSLQFVLCGNGPLKATLTQAATGLSNVHFLDLQPLERLSELLNTADIHLLPQKAQVSDLLLPSKLAGMLASGRPIVAMANPETGIALETAGAGLLIPPGDAKALAAAVIALAEDRALRARFGAAARTRASHHWDRLSIISALEREFLALPQRAEPAVVQPRPPTPSGRPIEQVATGTRRNPEFATRASDHRGRQRNRASSVNE